MTPIFKPALYDHLQILIKYGKLNLSLGAQGSLVQNVTSDIGKRKSICKCSYKGQATPNQENKKGKAKVGR